MDKRQKTAAVSTLLNLLLTICKFVLAGLSGSLVILADAWHSLTDVGTSLLVFISVSTGKNRKEPVQTPESDEPRAGIDWKNISREKWVSLLIGFVILLAAVGVAEKAIFAPDREIPTPYLFGIFFILFAGGSLVVSLFEVKVGRKLDSPGLIADGLHSRADMVSSLVAAGSLIALQLGLNQLGVNFDRIGAWIVVAFILSFSIETLVNFWWSLHGRKGWTDRVAIGFLAALLEPRTWKTLLGRLGVIAAWNRWPARSRVWFRRGAALVVIGGAALFLLLNCLTVIGPSEQGIRLRWGRVVNRGEPLQPGLHFHLPAPLERIDRVDARTIRRIEIGNIADPRAVALLWTREHGARDAFLSGENNFFHPYLSIHYRVKDIFDYRYSFHRPEDLLDNAANRLLTRLFASRIFVDIATTYREELEATVRKELQRQLDRLHSGLELVSVNTKDIHPPVEVADSYEQVIAALQEKQTRINRALGYRNSSIPEARGWAVRSVKEADAYALEREAAAAGEAGRFTARAESIGARPAITRPMLYRETVKETLDAQPLVLVDPALDQPEIWLRSARPVFLDDQF
ncbi:MAG: SPFH domain-containing protein [Candidatus Erginobacter occultus]|nr:SPFH domain-containing protein [Candidatus Erginobacter occultus]